MEYETKLGTFAPVHPSVTDDRVLSAVERCVVDLDLDDPGFCLACGEDAESVEPDARHYECESCGELAVFGAEEVLLMLFA